MNRYSLGILGGLLGGGAYACLHFWAVVGEISPGSFLNVCVSITTFIITLPTALDVAKAEAVDLGVLKNEKGSIIFALVLVLGFLMFNIGREFSSAWIGSANDPLTAQASTPSPAPDPASSVQGIMQPRP